MKTATRLPRRKWVHPLKGRTIKEVMVDALSEACPGKTFYEGSLDHNPPIVVHFEGVCSWCSLDYHTAQWNIHSWDSMKDCLKYGFTVGDDGCVTSEDNDWNQRQLLEKPKDVVKTFTINGEDVSEEEYRRRTK